MEHPERLLAAVFLGGAVLCGAHLYVSQPREWLMPYTHRAVLADAVETEAPTKAATSAKKTASRVTAATVPTDPTVPETTVPTADPFPLDLNTATAEELMLLPSIGAVRAQAIVDWREAHGGFSSIGQLVEVPGIGEAYLAAVEPYVCLPHPAPPPAAADVPQEVPQDVPEDLAAPVIEPPAEEEAPTVPPVIDLNTATMDDLLLLPGCDAESADAILRLRDTIHGFTSIYEILYAEHVTSGLFETWRPWLAVDAEGNIELPTDSPDTLPVEEDTVPETEEG